MSSLALLYRHDPSWGPSPRPAPACRSPWKKAVLLVHHGHAHLSVSPPSGPATFTYRHRPSTSACKQHPLCRCTAARLFSCYPSFSSLIQPSAGVPPRMPLAGVPPCVLHPSPMNDVGCWRMIQKSKRNNQHHSHPQLPPEMRKALDTTYLCV